MSGNVAPKLEGQAKAVLIAVLLAVVVAGLLVAKANYQDLHELRALKTGLP